LARRPARRANLQKTYVIDSAAGLSILIRAILVVSDRFPAHPVTVFQILWLKTAVNAAKQGNSR
jgi:hypothetical protein